MRTSALVVAAVAGCVWLVARGSAESKPPEPPAARPANFDQLGVQLSQAHRVEPRSARLPELAGVVEEDGEVIDDYEGLPVRVRDLAQRLGRYPTFDDLLVAGIEDEEDPDDATTIDGGWDCERQGVAIGLDPEIEPDFVLNDPEIWSHEIIQVSGTAPTIDQTPVNMGGVMITDDYTRTITTSRTFENVLGAAAGTQDCGTGVSFTGVTSLENTYIVDE